MKLTVIIRNDGPMFNFGDSPTYRTVVIDLNNDQIDKIKLEHAYGNGDDKYYEQISQCILE
jgi:hypothetical protein